MSLPDGAEFWWSTKGYYAGEEKRECKYWYYRVYIDDIFVKEGKFAHKQTRNLQNRVVYRRMWNHTKNEWRDSDWVLFQDFRSDK